MKLPSFANRGQGTEDWLDVFSVCRVYYLLCAILTLDVIQLSQIT